MKRTKLPVAEVERNLNGLQWGLLYFQDDIQLKAIAEVDMAAIDSPRLLEAHLFGGQTEIHIFEYDGKPGAVLIEDDSQEQIARKYKLTGRFNREKKDIYLHVRDYVSFDEDGMAYVEYSRPVKVE
jgi:hypothetical protein